MRKIINMFVALSVFLSLTACGDKKKDNTAKKDTPAVNIPVDGNLVKGLDAFAHSPRPSGNFGLYVYDLTAGKPVYSFDADKSQPLASNMKLLSGVAALHRMGANYKYYTSLYIKGPVVKDTLQGDIVFKAGLDPLLQPSDFSMFARELRRRHIKAIKGHCYLDLALKEKVKAEAHWYPWDLSYSHYGVLFKGPDNVKRALRTALANVGIRMADTAFVVSATPRGSHCAFRFNRSVDRVTKLMWKNSSNTQATSLLYTLGHETQPNNPDMAAAGVAYLRQFLRNDLGQRDTSLVVHDGCGLCTYNRLSPRAVAAVLIYAYREKPIYRQLMQNLAVSGEDGTLRRLISDPKLRGRIHGKTGTLSHPYGISSLAGYCKGANGHDLCFALLDSDMSVLDAHVLQRKLAKVLVSE